MQYSDVLQRLLSENNSNVIKRKVFKKKRKRKKTVRRYQNQEKIQF